MNGNEYSIIEVYYEVDKWKLHSHNKEVYINFLNRYPLKTFNDYSKSYSYIFSYHDDTINYLGALDQTGKFITSTGVMFNNPISRETNQ